MDDRPPAGDPHLIRQLASEIRANGPIPFERFMRVVLHDPLHGYYASGSTRIGPEGDFFTASDAGTVFGDCLARQIAEVDELLGRPARFDMVEFGGGRGLLARDVLESLQRDVPELYGRVHYTLIDSSEAMREAAVRNAPGAVVLAPGQVRPLGTGCVVAVELFDALPVHRVRRRGASLREVFVDWTEEDGLIERELDPVAGVEETAKYYGVAPEDGDESEICLDAAPMMRDLAGTVHRGVVFIVDYGYPASELYSARHRRGTLLAYHRHAANEDYLHRVGQQDLTAHVNFTQLEDAAREAGMTVLGLTTQERFLIGNGILDHFRSDTETAWRDPNRVRRRLQAMQLIHPSGMGRMFKVLVLSKGLAPPPSLAGLADPFDLDRRSSGT